MQSFGAVFGAQRVDKPWGHEEIWALSDTYCGKRLVVNAGEALSLQLHERKHETMFCIEGSGFLDVGPSLDALEVVALRPGVGVVVPVGHVHRLRAAADEPVVVLAGPRGGRGGPPEHRRRGPSRRPLTGACRPSTGAKPATSYYGPSLTYQALSNLSARVSVACVRASSDSCDLRLGRGGADPLRGSQFPAPWVRATDTDARVDSGRAPSYERGLREARMGKAL